MTYQFIQVAFDKLCAQENKNYFRDLARYVEKQDGDGLEDKLLTAFAESFPEDTAYWPIQILSFCQALMDRSCWLSRRFRKGMMRELDLYGVDPAKEIAEEFGFTLEPENVAETMQEEYYSLYLLTSLMTNFDSGSSEFDFELAMFDPASKDEEGNWVNVNRADTYKEAEVEMDNIVEKLNERDPQDILAKLRSQKAASTI